MFHPFNNSIMTSDIHVFKGAQVGQRVKYVITCFIYRDLSFCFLHTVTTFSFIRLLMLDVSCVESFGGFTSNMDTISEINGKIVINLHLIKTRHAKMMTCLKCETNIDRLP